ncbi:nucleoside 2-deoxyribosyltransferase [Pseudomonas sp. 10B1]|uniref:nucleoside 2-deoxyribosyltransferase n=1 Tax=unclassified Pseudomonas TaxID=196821 RepID=UPI002AB5C688|nr:MULTISPECIES: nucleoside 2-deoxyribosyltransferase [unclassified Pseudomonas]MDY7560933.1 nucleoside 2-deoxyribosyltransferase [Pseudomonas sp. AB6]MEA9978262.1 nucleoside 2-deoxyribosyltransferase [Pseudomonas sp. RTS4]MEA9995138.1 nucleoside 2-deoxyribosyltransferase [Pseudomonas sp. AA4]MEB0086988.1 nucleoside 2-deoxyribosyltransferase [Pseudomonas sp. RTI1]MEB0126745.1 nucleoside 2-deoxyribosyltransferase [Pseudomonas sp. CCC1.2]
MKKLSAPQIYLAGFDVFRPDAIEHGHYLKALCANQGIEGLYPFDNEVTEDRTPEATAQQICAMNIVMLRRCEGVLANLNVFRGLEPDSGTAFEVGMAVALGKPVWAYFDPIGSLRELVSHDPQGFDADGFMVEDFGLPRNLMLACSWAGVSATAEEAVIDMARHMAKGGAV